MLNMQNGIYWGILCFFGIYFAFSGFHFDETITYALSTLIYALFFVAEEIDVLVDAYKCTPAINSYYL